MGKGRGETPAFLLNGLRPSSQQIEISLTRENQP